MNILVELILEVAAGGADLGPSSDRGLVAVFTVVSVAFLAATLWLLTTSPDPLRQPVWGLGVLAGSLVCGGAGLLVSVLHLRRNDSQRAFSLFSLMCNAAAVVAPLFWTFSRVD